MCASCSWRRCATGEGSPCGAGAPLDQVSHLISVEANPVPGSFAYRGGAFRDRAASLARIVLGSDSVRVDAPNEPASGAGSLPADCAESAAACGLASRRFVGGNGLGARPFPAQLHVDSPGLAAGACAKTASGRGIGGAENCGVLGSAARAPATVAPAATARIASRSRTSRRPGIESSTAIAPGRFCGPVGDAGSMRAAPRIEHVAALSRRHRERYGSLYAVSRHERTAAATPSPAPTWEKSGTPRRRRDLPSPSQRDRSTRGDASRMRFPG